MVQPLLCSSRMKALVIATSVLAATSIVDAQPSLAGPDDVVIPAPEPAPHSAKHAVAISAEGTAASILLIGLGLTLETGNRGSTAEFIGSMALDGGALSLVVTPSLGHLYGEHRWLTPGFYVRAGGVAVVAAGAFVELADNVNGLFCSAAEGPCPAANNRGWMIAGAGGAMILAGAIYDIATAGSATDDYNAKHRVSMHFGPTAIRTPNNTTVAGIGFGGSF